MASSGQETPEPTNVKLTVTAVRTALKEALSGKYTEEHINKAFHDLGIPPDGVIDLKKLLENAPLETTDLMEPSADDLMDVNWAEFFGRLGLPMSEEEAKKVMSSAKVSFSAKARKEKPPETTSLESIPGAQELDRDVGSNIDLVAASEEEESELLKIIEELKVESDAISGSVTPVEDALDTNVPTQKTGEDET